MTTEEESRERKKMYGGRKSRCGAKKKKTISGPEKDGNAGLAQRVNRSNKLADDVRPTEKGTILENTGQGWLTFATKRRSKRE